MRNPEQYPLLTMALGGAFCAVSFFVFSGVWPPAGSSDDAAGTPAHTARDLEKYSRALADLRHAGLADKVDVLDFGNGVGLGVSQSVGEGEVVLQVPEFLALDAEVTRNCPAGAPDDAAGAPLDCQVERVVTRAVRSGQATRLTGLLALLVMEGRRGRIAGLEPGATSAVLAVLPAPSWQAEYGLFAIDSEEFRVLGAGTSMEGWRAVAVNQAAQAHGFIQASVEGMIGGDVSLEEVRWAYLILHAHAQWVADDDLDAGIGVPAQAVFLWPLFLARSTPDWAHGVRLHYDPDRRTYEALATRALRQGEEVLFVDRRLSDASVLCFQGLWLSGRHRARFSFDVSAVPRDPQSQPILDKYGCGARPLQLYLAMQKAPDPQFLGCMRMLAVAGNHTRLLRAKRSNWTKSWPDTVPIGRQAEAAAAELAIGSLQQALNRLSSPSLEIRRRYGSDAVATRPAVRVREAETMVVVNLLRSMKELQLLGGGGDGARDDSLQQRKRRTAAAV